ncbi:MAG: excinuclease ABC subunit UvrC [Candidatus Gracilibacteria bacterium]
MEKSHISALVKKLPHIPGVYKMKDKDGKIIYIGKAKDLGNRVRSYFRMEKNRPMRTQKMVENICDLEWIEVSSELEALFLETNLIKEIRPKYNVLMKDDKNFVYIKITKEDFPRIQIVRKVEKDGARYFGPKTASHNVRKTLMLLQKLFQYRSCDLGMKWLNGKAEITNKTIAYPCLDYHIKRCQAPCISAVSPGQYLESIKKIEYFLDGKTDEIEEDLKRQIGECALAKEFEKAALLRDKLHALKELTDFKQVVTSPDHQNADVLAFVLASGKAYFNLFMLRDGKLIGQENFVLDSTGFDSGDEESATEVMESFLEQYYEKAVSFPSEILVSNELTNKDFFEKWISGLAEKTVKVLVPERGKKHRLIELAEKNAESFKKQHKARWETSEGKEDTSLPDLAVALSLPRPPKRIECFDISHFGGEDTVASMVVFENGVSKNSDYRKFHLKTLGKGEIDDFKSMEEILRRRLAYLGGVPKGIKFKKATKTNQKDLEKLFKEWKGETFVDEIGGYTVALKNKKVIGLLGMKPGKNKDIFLVKALYVTPRERENGIAKSLMSWAFENKKAKRVYLSCRNEMTDFYKSFGFEEVKKFPAEFEDAVLESLLAFDPSTRRDSSFDSKPDLIVIDGGKGQLSSALKSRNHFGLKIPMIGLAKKEEEIFVEGKSKPIILQKDSQALLLLRRIRDEAHRFAITFQRKTREKTMYK